MRDGDGHRRGSAEPPTPAVERPGRPAVVAATATVAGGVALAAWEGTLWRSSAGSQAGVLAAIAAAVVATLVAGRGRHRAPDTGLAPSGARLLGGDRRRLPMATMAGVVVWAALVLATVAWDLYSFARQRHDLPTLSRLCGDVTGHHWGRALLFAVWLALGAAVALGWRARSLRPSRRPVDARR